MRERGWRSATTALAAGTSAGVPAGIAAWVAIWIAVTVALTAAQAAVSAQAQASAQVPVSALASRAVRTEARPPAPRYEGRRIVDVLAQLQTDGARIIFTNSLVPRALMVKTEPRARTPRQLAAEILAPHGLALRNGPGGIWLVVRAEAPAAGGPRPASPKPAAPRAAAASASAAAAYGEPYGDDVTPSVEEHIDVTERLGEFAGQASVQVVDVAAVREAAGGFEDVFHVMPTFPGIAATDDKQGKLAVRGAGPQHNVVIFDGVQIYSPQRFSEFPTSFVNPETAASVALDASGLDARHGGRLSSVMVLETRDGRTDRRLALSGSASLTNGDVLAEGRLPGTKSGSWWTTVRGTYYRAVSQPFHDGVIPNFTDVQLKVTVRPTEHTRLSFLGLVGHEGMKRTGSGVPDLPADVVWRRLDTNNRLGVVNLWWTPNRRVSTTTTVSTYSNASEYFNYIVNAQGGAFQRNYEISDVAVRQRATVVWRPGHVLDAGVETRRVRSRWAMTGSAPSLFEGGAGPDVWGQFVDYEGPIHDRLARTHVSTWLQERVPIGAGLELEPGLRLDWNSLTRERALQPRLRVTKRLRNATIWAGLAWQAQTPGHEAMQQGFQFYDFSSPEAVGLRNERSRQVVAGVEQPLGAGLTLRMEAYRRDFDRLLVQRQETEAERQQRLVGYDIPPDMPAGSALTEFRPTVHPRSTGEGRASGLEVLLQRDGRRFSGWLTYTLSKSERELFGRTVPFDFDRRHAAGAVASVRLTRAFRLATTWQFASGFPGTAQHPEVQFYHPRLPDGSTDPILRPLRVEGGELALISIGDPRRRLSLWNTARLEPYIRGDARVTWTPSPRWELYGEVINLLNRHNLEQSLLWHETDGPDREGRQPVYESYGRLLSYGIRVKF